MIAKTPVSTLCWHRKYIAINDKAWAQRMALMGGHAPEKHALSLDLPQDQAKQLLRGIMADSRVNDSSGWTFTTTSHQLMVQTRVLHKMFGRSSSVMYITNHGGLGKNPIWRLGVREPNSKAAKLLARQGNRARRCGTALLRHPNQRSLRLSARA